MKLNWNQIDDKWRNKWHESKDFETDPNDKPKKFITVAYPYPNSPQHIGHGRTYTLADVHSRYYRMKGFNVLFPMGFHYTGTPILGMSKRVQANDEELIEAFKNLYNVPEEKIKEFVDPVKIADYFHEEIKAGMIEMGYSIDWRREFTTIIPAYQKFIEWQFRNLKEKNLIVQGNHPVGWCPNDQNPVSQHDTIGDVEPDFTEYIIIKFSIDDEIIPVATLRPETLFGVTNLWINPKITYKKVKVDGETWIISSECAYKLEFLNKKIEIIEDISGSDLIGKKVQSPTTDNKFLILPASFVTATTGTGIVMSVPAHAPYDFQALEDIKNGNQKNIEDSLRDEVKQVQPITIITTKGFGEIPSQDVINRMKIRNQDDPKLEDATKEIYSKEFYEGKLNSNTGEFVGKKIKFVKDEVKEWISKTGKSDIMLELTNESVKCRCGTECVVKLLNNQWFLDYANKEWKAKAHTCFESMNILPNDIRTEFFNVLDWLRERACARQHGLGTKVPWDKDWLVESLADSVIYMSFYTMAKFVNSGEILAENMSDEFFNYIFYENGNSETIARNTKITTDKLDEIRKEFVYFYPVDSRHSGRDLVPNHLTFFVLNHVALFPKENWPKEIVVNGSVLMDGKKMSKSMGNIIPLRDAIRKYGADPIRLSILISAELLQDADFNVESISGIKNKLESMYEECNKINNSEHIGTQPEDIWIQSRLSKLISEVTDSMEKMRLRESLHHILYGFDSDLQWYMKRANAKNRDDISGILNKVLKTRITMLSPFAPHIAEEMWEKLGNSEMVSKSLWPKEEDKQTDDRAIQSESLLSSVMNDISNIIKVTKIKPKKITIYTADNWKSKAYHKILSGINSGETNVGIFIKELISQKETENVKKDPDFVKKTLKDILSEPTDLRKTKMNAGEINESEIISNELSSLIETDYKIKLQVFSENDSEKYDPKNKARIARPYKPAILIE
ncbi:MAG TPA: leucine--tRNA ligase [Candidatus Nitrosopelagicus sp.]|nr:leucine--tRNA ligase [Candidatus Nitrosopelagicus sp.]